ncbi:unnamed protein product [Calypogeia fissa]
MPEIIVLDDDDDGFVPMASTTESPPPQQPSPPPPEQEQTQSSLTEEQRQRMAKQKELALARRLAREKFYNSRLAGGQEQQQSGVSSHTETHSQILVTSQFPTAVVDPHNNSGWHTGIGFGTSDGGGHSVHGNVSQRQGEVAGGTNWSFKRKHQEEGSNFIDLTTSDGDQDGWRSVRKRPVPGQSFGREITNSEQFYTAEGVVVHGETIPSSTHHNFANDDSKSVPKTEERAMAGGPRMTEDPNVDGQNPPPPQTVAKRRPSEQQIQVLNAIRNGKSVFLTGSAGTGKSFVLEFAIRLLKIVHGGDGIYVTASTGLAACALGGTTVHSFAGVGLGTGKKDVLVERAKGRREVRNRWLYAKALIIDEISMIDGEFFDKLDYIGRILRNKSQPFGGIQLVVTGDFYQLPPVNPENPKKYFAFEADCWDKCFDMQIELKTVFRQSDQEFVAMLNEIRRGHCPPSIRDRLQNCSGPVGDKSGIILTRLYPRKMDVGRENDQNLRALGQPTVVFEALDEARNDFARKQLDIMRVEPVISLSLGAQVMLAKNLETSAGLVNGARGVVVGFTRAGERRGLLVEEAVRAVSPSGQWPLVRFACDGQERVMVPESWTIMEGEKEVARRIQLPLLLAWALSVHKCQGMTLDRVETDLSRAFDYGMVYVALSRVKSLEGLRLIGFDPSKIKIHKKVALFYEKLKQANDCNENTCTGIQQS